MTPKKWDWLLDETTPADFFAAGSMIKQSIMRKISGHSDLVKCALCPNMCRHACPISIVEGSETTSPAGKARVAFLLEEGKLEKNLETMKSLYMCLSCEACAQWCPFEFSVANLTRTTKKKAVEQGLLFGPLEEVLENLEEYHYLYGKPREEEALRKEATDLLYLRGCTIREKLPTIPEKTLTLLEKIGEPGFVLENEKCCGIPAYNIGNLDQFKDIARANAKLINSTKASTVVTSCPSCTYAYKKLYPEFGINLQPNIVHITQFLQDHLDHIQAKPRTVTIHDPCKLALGLEKPDILKNILQQIEAISVQVPRRSGEHTFCCGSGGSVLSRLHPQLSKEIGLERLEELQQEASTIVTACPTCKLAFEENKEDTDVEVLDIIEIVTQE